jgi:hypothetical protein
MGCRCEGMILMIRAVSLIILAVFGNKPWLSSVGSSRLAGSHAPDLANLLPEVRRTNSGGVVPSRRDMDL